MQIDRETAQQHLRRGFPVQVGNRVVHPVKTGGRYTHPELPPAEAGDDYTALRHEDGSLSRAGMVQVIQSGGSVAIGGEVIDNVDNLPPEDVLAEGDVQRLEALYEQQEQQAAALAQERQRTKQQLRRAAEKAERQKDQPKEQPKQVRVLGTPPPPPTPPVPPPPPTPPKE